MNYFDAAYGGGNSRSALSNLQEAQAEDQLMAYEINRPRMQAQIKEQQRLRSMAEQFNEDPTTFTDAEVKWLTDAAPQFGINISAGLAKDSAHRAGWGQQLKAGAMGALDMVLFDLLKDSWYSDRHTKTAKNVGKVLGFLGSLYYGGSIAKGITKAGGIAKQALGLTDDAARAVTNATNALNNASTLATAAQESAKAANISASSYTALKAKAASLTDELAKIVAKKEWVKTPEGLQAIRKSYSTTNDALKAVQKQIGLLDDVLRTQKEVTSAKQTLDAVNITHAEALGKSKAALDAFNKTKKAGFLNKVTSSGFLRGYKEMYPAAKEAWAAKNAIEGASLKSKIFAFTRPIAAPLARDAFVLNAMRKSFNNADPMNIPVELLASQLAVPGFNPMYGYGADPRRLPMYNLMGIHNQPDMAALQQMAQQQ